MIDVFNFCKTIQRMFAVIQFYINCTIYLLLPVWLLRKGNRCNSEKKESK